MDFISLAFPLFLTILFLLYWRIGAHSVHLQNLLLLFSGYFFYGTWSLKFLSILIGLSVANYLIGRAIERDHQRKKGWLSFGIIFNVGILSCFKYFDFFIDNFIDLCSRFSINIDRPSVSIILPVGISFYVFISISYIVDIYRNKLRGDNPIVDVLLSLGFFPVLLSGPIQRPVQLIPQLQEKKVFDPGLAADGLRQILWGAFMKILIADNCAVYVNDVFSNFNSYSGSTLFLGAIFFMVQIYADFAGYSEIAIGTSKLFGIRLMTNFSYPYFAINIAEFWRRWHISLTTWFRDYLFLPLAYYFSGKIKRSRIWFFPTDWFIYSGTSFIVWILIGFWHGSNFTFIFWGLIHAVCIILYQLTRKSRKQFFRTGNHKMFKRISPWFSRVTTLIIILISWIMFRSVSLSSAWSFLQQTFSASLLSLPTIYPAGKNIVIILLFSIEWVQRKKAYTLDLDRTRMSRPIRWTIYYLLFFLTFWLGGDQQQFIYFQF